MRFTLVRLSIAALMIGTLAGCGGGGGNNGGGTPAVVTPPPAAGGGTVTPPTGAAPITLTAATPAATFAALNMLVPAVAVTINGPPQVTFSLTDQVGNAIIGFGSISQGPTAIVPSHPNLTFSLAKLVPSVGTAPSKWVTYMVTRPPTVAEKGGAVAATKSCDSTTAPTVCGTSPTTDTQGTLVDQGNGVYTYTFFRDVKQASANVGTLIDSADAASSLKADLGDVSFDPTLVHRLTIQISGNAPGTGTNVPNGVADPAVPGVVMANPLNVIFDFVPARVTATNNGAVTATDPSRDIASTAKCNECHQNLGGFPALAAADQDAEFHGGSRNKVEYCIMCHNDQLKYGHKEAAVVTQFTYDGKDTAKINGLSIGALTSHIHKIHMSEGLTKTGYNVGIAYETACRFPQDVRNCTKCHDGSATSTAKTAQGDNWMNVPNRTACGACHDGINFAGTAGTGVSGTGYTLADFEAGTTATSNGHLGGVRLDDSKCALCHDATTIPLNHIPVTPPNTSNGLFVAGADTHSNAAFIASNTSNVPAGAIKPSYVILSVSTVVVNASKRPQMVFKMQQNGADVPFLGNCTTSPCDLTGVAVNPDTVDALAVPPVPGTKEMWPHFMGSPSVQFVFAVPEDGLASPADFNGAASGYLRNIWNGTATGTGAGTLTGPDASGFYTVTLTGVIIPANATMLTGGLGYSYDVKSSLPLTQTNVVGFPTTTPSAAVRATLTLGNSNRSGGLIVVATDAQVPATGVAGRRPIVDDKLCNRCHQELGPFTKDAFHAGQRNDGTTCAWCHNPNQNNAGWSGDSTSFVHAIHAAAKRTTPFTWHAVSATDNFSGIGYPGILNNCVTCHLPNTFDFSAPASTAALPNRLYRTVATGTTVAATFSTSPYIDQVGGFPYGAGFSYNAATGVATQAAASTLVNSPIAAACFGCHDDPLSMGHIRSNGGSLYARRDVALVTVEQCTLCHLTGGIADIAVVHK